MKSDSNLIFTAKEGIKMEDKTKGFCKHIEGIVCDAKNCVYNEGECHCCAEQIFVGPVQACCSNETECATFKPRNED